MSSSMRYDGPYSNNAHDIMFRPGRLEGEGVKIGLERETVWKVLIANKPTSWVERNWYPKIQMPVECDESMALLHARESFPDFEISSVEYLGERYPGEATLPGE